MAVWSTVKLSSLTADVRLDAEYYRPDLLKLDRALKVAQGLRFGDIGGHFIVGPFGSDFAVENYVEDSPYRYVRGKDVKPVFLKDDDNAYIPQTEFDRLAKYALKPFDVLISVVGTLGNCAIVPETIGKAVFSCKSTVWRPPEQQDDLALYLTAYLNCTIGQRLFQRLPRGHVQTGLNLDDLRSIPVVVPDNRYVKRIAAMVRQSQTQISKSKNKIIAAEQLLTEALVIGNLNLTPQQCYIRQFSDLRTGNRFGAEYYMPCKQRVLNALAKLPHRTIADHAPAVREIFDPSRAPKAEMVRNFDLTDALDPFLQDDAAEPQSAMEIGSIKKRFQPGDVVISRLRSYLKEISIVRTSRSVPSVGSSEFIVLRPTGQRISAETLMVFLRSPLVQTVLRWSQDGSNHPRFAEEDLLVIPIPEGVRRVQKRIDGLVQEAMADKCEAARQLETAKRTVENMISTESKTGK